jgi:hypothetical protein
MGAGWRKEAIDLGSEQSEIFFACQLDDPNQIESTGEIEFYAHVIFSRPGRFQDCASFGIDLICSSSGKSLCRFDATRCARHHHSGRRVLAGVCKAPPCGQAGHGIVNLGGLP